MVVYENIKLFLDKNNDKNINFCVSNNRIHDMVKNLIISCKKNNIKIVLFALDEIIIKNLKNDCDIVKYYNLDFSDKIFNKNKKIDANKNYVFGTGDFRDVVNQRFFIANEILKKNKFCTYLDSDLVIQKNFEDNVSKKFKENPEVDCFMQLAWKNYFCTGFFSMRPNNKNKKLDYKFFKDNKYYRFKHDQEFFNDVIIRNNIINVKPLEQDLYVHGNDYYENNVKYDNKCVLIHFNCVKGMNEKIRKMKQYKKWYL